MNIDPAPKCVVCGGTASMRKHAAAGLDRHHLCAELKKRGLPTPSLGDECPDCHGSTTTRKSMPANIFLPINPTGAELKLWFPPCPTCEGKGYIGG